MTESSVVTPLLLEGARKPEADPAQSNELYESSYAATGRPHAAGGRSDSPLFKDSRLERCERKG